MVEFALLVTGLIGLWFGTRLAVNNAVELANAYNLSQTFIGLTVLAIGTDLPETFISINSSIHRLQGMETSGIVLGNAIGSGICQISLIIGLSGLFVAHSIERKIIFREGGIMLGSILVLFVVGYNRYISRLEGILLVIMFVAYYYFLMKKELTSTTGTQLPIPDTSLRKRVTPIILLLLTGLAIVIFSSELVVRSAVQLAEAWHIRQTFVGIIIIGLGTSLPELSVSIGAVFKKTNSIALGNILGSNIYDTLIPAGLGALISPLKVGQSLYSKDLPILLLVSFITLFLLQSKKGLQRKEALGLVFFYLIYTYWKWSSF